MATIEQQCIMAFHTLCNYRFKMFTALRMRIFGKAAAFGICCLAASRTYAKLPGGCMPCCLGDLCLAALGMNALLPLWIWSFAAQRKIQLGSQKRIIQCGSLQDYSAWLPGKDCSACFPENVWSLAPKRTIQLSFPNYIQSKFTKFKNETQLFSFGECYSNI